ncbi:hypothetical protein HCA15_11100 [Listeria booriae]|uniref:hypothetical protein n=1 Tax=Listeria booriae TaxID=1552123 RepID=UPI0016298974|nr:hypothetical protein [Listeria booriae]MBC2259753.1 hypothetical protein [Listeria booriae]MBC6164992.1 hypothetical protein [Listeria booriae]MBC6167189.1 hypothetical protein [Listeria booriae]
MKVYVILTKTTTIPGKIIQKYTRKPFNHVSISLTEDLSEVYSFGRIGKRNFLNGGFIKEDVRSGVLEKSAAAILSYEITPEQQARIQRELDWFRFTVDNYRYNFWGILGLVLRLNFSAQNEFFCSQFVGHVLEVADISVVGDTALHFLQPHDFLYEGLMEVEFCGRMDAYVNRFAVEKPELLALASV